ncbi:MAG: hypothetical protein KatS3mg121_0877 [Gammaproteobacteria bacterium]|nr:MAG: hypothetical protein KatS3mg121_0877 [Gammaproteobacteria bacterium]
MHLEVDSEGDGRIDDPDTRYLHRDHLGSVVAVTDEVGLVHDPSGRTRVEPVAFDPFGRRLGPDWLDDPAAARAPGSPGHLDYTGQEALPEVGLIHMNGRLYDPELGRFLAADPFVQAPGEPGNHNRYVYVLNNPLRYSDPTGHLFEDFKDFVITVIIIVVSIECQPCGAALAAGYALYRGAEPWQVVLSFVAGMAGGALASTAGATGLQAAIISGLVSGAITGMITAWVSGGNIARGMVLGAISGAIGGAVNYALQSGVQEVMQPSQPSGGTRGDALEEVIIVDEWEKPDVPRGRTKEISRETLREIEENSPNQEAWKDNVKGIDKLDGLSDKLKPKAESVLKELSEKGYKLRVVWGKRTKAENDALVKEGLASKTSKHLTGDAMGFVNRKLGYDVEKGSDYLKNLKTAADNAGVIWGGDFESRWDPNHIELK